MEKFQFLIKINYIIISLIFKFLIPREREKKEERNGRFR